ncbi:MAG TPA: hypothetical protein VF342_09280 [Alphaproteobacteria bacterium]
MSNWFGSQCAPTAYNLRIYPEQKSLLRRLAYDQAKAAGGNRTRAEVLEFS